MKILYVAAWFPYPPDNGARLRTYYTLKALAASHEVHLISMLQEDSDSDQARNLRDLCHVVSLHNSRWFRPGTAMSAVGYFSPVPRSVVDTYDPEIRRAMETAMARIQPDVVVTSTLGAAPYVPAGSGVPCLLDEHNCEYGVLKRSAASRGSLVGRFLGELGWRKFARWEAGMCRRYTAVSVVSHQDREMLLQAAPDLKNVPVVPNGVDTGLVRPTGRHAKPGYLLYNGALTYGANLDAVRWFASDIYPLIAREYPDARLRVTGRTTGVALGDLEANPAVELIGYVGDIRQVLSESAVCVIPLRQGGGSRLKVLEAMAAGVPVVSTHIGVEGLDLVAGEHFLEGNTPTELATAVRTILSDVATASRLSDNARKLVEERYDWGRIGRLFVDAVEGCTPHNSRSRPCALQE